METAIMFPKPAKQEKKAYKGLQRRTPLTAKTGLKSSGKKGFHCRPNGGHVYHKAKTGY